MKRFLITSAFILSASLVMSESPPPAQQEAQAVNVGLHMKGSSDIGREIRMYCNGAEIVWGVSVIEDIKLPAGILHLSDAPPRIPGTKSYIAEGGTMLINVDRQGRIMSILLKLNQKLDGSSITLESDVGIVKGASMEEVHMKLDTDTDKGKELEQSGLRALTYHNKRVGILFEFADGKLSGLFFGR